MGEQAKQESFGYFALGLVQSIGGIWRQWTSGKHWKVDVDDILDSSSNDEGIEIVEWVKDIKTDTDWDIEELLESTNETQRQHLIQLFRFIKDGLIAYYKYQIADPLL